ncbi:MAG: ComEC family competence protein [bacterium ADurb.Bin212]|nr:MAG: ComEC family competence protein [bacterium ADurb.Bin212]
MKKKLVKYIFGLLIIILVAIWAEIAKSPKDNGLKIYFFDVAQGDATLVSKGDYQILIDGGPSSDVLSGVGEVMPPRDREIEAVVLTHPHADHLVGLNQILERYNVKQIYLSGVLHTSNQYLEFLQKIKDSGISSEVPQINQQFVPFEGAVFEFLWPGDKYRNKEVDNLNNSSLVTKFCYLEQCALFMGDLETDAQAEMFMGNSLTDYSAQILKISHHGSTNGTNQTLLEKVRPKYTVISVGADNKYGHPHNATLKLIEQFGVSILRTDRDGTIIFELSEATIIVNK